MRKPSHRPLLLVALGAALTSTGCAPPIPDGGFDAPDPASRIYAAVRVAADFERTGIRPDRTTLEDLVVMLASSDPATRFIASQTLREIAGTDLGYHPSAPLPERTLAADRWRAWVEALPVSSGEQAS